MRKKTANIVKYHCGKENYAQKYQMSSAPAAGTPVDWPKDSQKFDIYITEKGIYELLFLGQQPKTKDFRRHFCNVLFPHAWQQLTNKMKEDHKQAIEEKDNQTQEHQQKILRLSEEIDDFIKTGT